MVEENMFSKMVPIKTYQFYTVKIFIVRTDVKGNGISTKNFTIYELRLSLRTPNFRRSEERQKQGRIGEKHYNL